MSSHSHYLTLHKLYISKYWVGQLILCKAADKNRSHKGLQRLLVVGDTYGSPQGHYRSPEGHCKVGINKKWTFVFVNFTSQVAPILKISVPIIKRRSWGFQNTPNLQSLDYFEPSYGNLKKIKDNKNPDDIQFCSKYKWIFKCLKTLLFWKCHNLAQSNPNFANWRCVLPFLSAPTVRFLSLKLIHPVFTLHVSVHISW